MTTKTVPSTQVLRSEIKELEADRVVRTEELAEAERAAQESRDAVLAGTAEPGSGAHLKDKAADLQAIVAKLDGDISSRQAGIEMIQQKAARQEKVDRLTKISNDAARCRAELEATRRELAETMDRCTPIIQGAVSELAELRYAFIGAAEEICPRFMSFGEKIDNSNRNFPRATEEEMQALVDDVIASGGDLSAVRIGWRAMTGKGDNFMRDQGWPFIDPDYFGLKILADLGDTGRDIDERAGLRLNTITYAKAEP